MSSDATALTSDLRLAQALSAAERRLAMLERLAEMGMAIAQEITKTVVEFPHREGAGPQGARAFANVSRAVRLTVALAARVEKHILALRKHGLRLEPVASSDLDTPRGSVGDRRERVRSALADALEREASDASEAETLLRRMDERLVERDDFGAFFSRPFRDCVEAVCADLGLDARAVLEGDGADAELAVDDGMAGEGAGGPAQAQMIGPGLRRVNLAVDEAIGPPNSRSARGPPRSGVEPWPRE